MSEDAAALFSFTAKIDPKILAEVLDTQPITIAGVVLQFIDFDKRAKVLQLLDKKNLPKIVKIMSQPRDIPQDILKQVAIKIKQKCVGVGQRVFKGGLKTTAEILKAMPNRELLMQLKDEEPLLFEALSKEMVDIDKVLDLHEKHKQLLLSMVNDTVLAQVVQGLNKDQRDRLLCAVSKRRAIQIVEQLGNFDRNDMESGMKVLFEKTQACVDSGRIVFNDGGPYV